MRYFNTAGPCMPQVHYMVPAEPRLPEARGLIDRGQYFVVHAPRQTGKTTTLSSLARDLTAEGHYVAVRFSCETGEPAGDDYGKAEENILYALHREAELMGLSPELAPPALWPDAPAGSRLTAALTAWSEHCPRPLVLFFDEIDALRGESLRSVLRQLRDGFATRPDSFPHSVVLCGLRDVRDYKAASGGDPSRLGTSSPFNVKVASLRIGDFTPDDVRDLCAQHTVETGQPFTDEALERAFAYTQGQPWLVNALAGKAVDVLATDRTKPVSAEHMDEARELLILERATHLDSLVARLQETRVKRIIEPLIAGNFLAGGSSYDEDVVYVRDLGLISPRPPVAVANPIYREVIVRVLGQHTEDNIDDDPHRFVRDDGRLDFRMLLVEFSRFWRQHADILVSGLVYHEPAPQLVLMAYLHRIVNGGGLIEREYGVGRGRIDLVVRWPYTEPAGERAWQYEAVDLKVWRSHQPDPLPEGLAQLDEYLDRLDLDHGTLVIFDRRPEAAPLADRVAFTEERSPRGRTVTVLRA